MDSLLNNGLTDALLLDFTRYTNHNNPLISILLKLCKATAAVAGVTVVVVGGVLYLACKVIDSPAGVQQNNAPRRQYYNLCEFNELSSSKQREYIRWVIPRPKEPSEIPGFEHIQIRYATEDEMCIFECGNHAQIVNLPCGHILACWQCDVDFITTKFSTFVENQIRQNMPNAVIDEAFFASWMFNANTGLKCMFCNQNVAARVFYEHP